jgi:hypothetical protein
LNPSLRSASQLARSQLIHQAFRRIDGGAPTTGVSPVAWNLCGGSRNLHTGKNDTVNKARTLYFVSKLKELSHKGHVTDATGSRLGA